jgi:hypothetical protein
MPITIEGDIDPYTMPTTIGEFLAMVDSNHLAAEMFAVSGSSTANSFMDCCQDGTRVVDLVGCAWKAKSEEKEGKRNAPYSKFGRRIPHGAESWEFVLINRKASPSTMALWGSTRCTFEDVAGP